MKASAPLCFYHWNCARGAGPGDFDESNIEICIRFWIDEGHWGLIGDLQFFHPLIYHDIYISLVERMVMWFNFKNSSVVHFRFRPWEKSFIWYEMTWLTSEVRDFPGWLTFGGGICDRVIPCARGLLGAMLFRSSPAFALKVLLQRVRVPDEEWGLSCSTRPQGLPVRLFLIEEFEFWAHLSLLSIPTPRSGTVLKMFSTSLKIDE